METLTFLEVRKVGPGSNRVLGLEGLDMNKLLDALCLPGGQLRDR